jgi:hypothetical protein
VFRHPIVWLAIALALQAQPGFRHARASRTSSAPAPDRLENTALT